MHNFLSKIVLKFQPSVSIYMSIKTNSLHKGDLRAEWIGNCDIQFFCMFCWDFWCMLGTTVVKKSAPCNIYFFSEIMNRIVYLKWASKHAILVSFREIWTFNSFLFRILLHNRFCAEYFMHPLQFSYAIFFSSFAFTSNEFMFLDIC